jgi:hypothetical protein
MADERHHLAAPRLGESRGARLGEEAALADERVQERGARLGEEAAYSD